MSHINSRVFDPASYALKEEDFMQLDAPRPLGLSGHMRVRNEALTLRACLDSCLPFLDELIVTYNDSEDDTENILLDYAARYPQKIRLYWYPLEWGTCRGVMQMRPYGHLAHFCNFGYTKLRYAFYMKIDADQVYFTPKMLFIRDILFHNVMRIHRGQKPTPFPTELPQPYAFYEKTILRALTLHKSYTFILGGVEACFTNDDFYVYTSENLDEQPLFNGVFMDTFLMNPTSAQRYHMQGDFFEVFLHKQDQCASLGLHWVHFGRMKRKDPCEHSDIIPLREASTWKWEQVYEKVNTKPTVDVKMHNIYRNTGRRFWEKDVPAFLTQAFYETYCKDMLPLARAYFA